MQKKVNNSYSIRPTACVNEDPKIISMPPRLQEGQNLEEIQSESPRF